MKQITVFLLALIFLAGCAFNSQTKTERVAKNLSAGKTTLIAVAESVDGLCTEGILNQAQCDNASGIYVTAQVSHTLAVDALIIATAADTDSAWEGFFNATKYFNETVDDLIVFIATVKGDN